MDNKVQLPVLTTTSFITNCKHCVFAEKWGNHQTGCEFGRIERFRNNGGIDHIQERWKKVSELVEDGHVLAESVGISEYNNQYLLTEYRNGKFEKILGEPTVEVDYEEEETYYQIPRYCDKCRNEHWADFNKGKNLKEKATEESLLKTTVLIVVNDETDLEKLKLSLASVENQTFPAHEIIVLNISHKHKMEGISDILKNVKIKYFRHSKPLVKDLEYGLMESFRDAKGKWVIVVNNLEELPLSLINDLDIMINYRLERCILWNVNKNIYIAQKLALYQLGIQGIIEKAKEDKCENLIKTGA